MSDMINRQDAIDAYVKYTIDCLSPEENLSRPFTAILRKLPSAERKGKWIAYNGNDPNWLRNDGSPVFMQCSECNAMVINNFATNWNYCPNCGARMGEHHEQI